MSNPNVEIELERFRRIQRFEIMKFYGNLKFPSSLAASNMLQGVFCVTSDSQLGRAIYECNDERTLNFAYDLVKEWTAEEARPLISKTELTAALENVD